MLSIKKQLEEYLSTQTGISYGVKVTRPEKSEHGDYATNLAFLLAKERKIAPVTIAQDLASQMNKSLPTFLHHVEAVSPGFLNFYLNEAILVSTVLEFTKKGLRFEGKKQKIVVEYSSPNIAKPFTIGHLRSTIIGDAVANLLEAVGWDVDRDNHVGDWGTQFGKQIYAIKTWGNEEEIENSDRPVKLLVDLYIKFHEEAEKNPELEDEGRKWFKKLEEGDPEARDLWQKCINWSWKEFDAIYKQLGVPSMPGKMFENNGRGYGEAFFEDKMSGVIDELTGKHLLEEGKEGSKIVNFPEQTKFPPLMIIKKDGATLYATRDLATDRYRLFEKYGKDTIIINEVGVEQSLYFQQLYTLEEMLGWVTKGQRVHIKHGLYRFKEGKMSTRKGNVIWLEDVLEEAEKRAFDIAKDESIQEEKEQNKRNKFDHLLNHNEAQKLAHQIAIGALKWNDLKRSPEQDIAFDWDDVLNMQGNSGPYMQYTYVRTRSVLAKAKELGVSGGVDITDLPAVQKEELILLRSISRFDEIVATAAETFSPSILAQYLYELAQDFNLFYQKYPILKQDSAVTVFRLQLTAGVGKVIKDGLTLLGIETPEKM